jgi:hypothetical protein
LLVGPPFFDSDRPAGQISSIVLVTVFNMRGVHRGKINRQPEGGEELLKALAVNIITEKKQMEAGCKEAKVWLDGGCKGVDELYMYLFEKLKSKNIQYKDAENDPISAHADQNVVNYLQQLQTHRTKAHKEMFKFGSLRGDLSRIGDAVADIKKQIAEKREISIGSGKFKAKIPFYEGTLKAIKEQADKLDTKLVEISSAVKGGISLDEVNQYLEVKPSTTLKQLSAKLSSVKGLYKDYEQKLAGVEDAMLDREAKEFAQQLEMIKQMVADAKEIEAEGGAQPIADLGDLRKSWSDTKKKHADHIKKIKFKSDLGPSLETLDKLNNNPVKTLAQAKVCSGVAKDYLDKVEKEVADATAKKELTKTLTEIKKECDRLVKELS